MRRMVPVAAVLVVANIAALPATQAPQPPSFEVASVKRRTEPGPRSLTQPQGLAPGGGFNMVNVPALRLLMYAYDVRDYQVVGGPEWVRSDRFDIAARAGREVSPSDMRLMVQSLLEDRFKLAVRKEQREMPIYELVMAHSDKRLGPNLVRSEPDCRRMIEKPPNTPVVAATLYGCGPMSNLVTAASGIMGAPVIDRTGLSGAFERSMYYAPTGFLADGRVPLDTDPNLPAFGTALQEQLGLKLERTNGSVDVIVVAAIEPPSPD